MPDEHGATIIGGTDAELRSMGRDVAELKGEVRQMDKRLSNVEIGIESLRREIKESSRWILGVVLGTWVTLMLALVSFAMAILSRLH